jgi:Transposase IS116/IS110/IS902 family
MMNRRQLSPGRQFATLPAATFDDRVSHRGRWRSTWAALGPLAFGMMLALGASPAAALSPTQPATGFGGSSSVSPVKRELPVNDLDAAERLTALGERYLELHAFADAEAPDHLASWAALCPGNNESAGKHKSGKTRKGNRWLRTGLIEAAAGASRAKDSCLTPSRSEEGGRRHSQRLTRRAIRLLEGPRVTA